MMRSFVLVSALLGLAAAKEWSVTVGKGGNLKFDPETIDGAAKGDIINYSFFAKVRNWI